MAACAERGLAGDVVKSGLAKHLACNVGGMAGGRRRVGVMAEFAMTL